MELVILLCLLYRTLELVWRRREPQTSEESPCRKTNTVCSHLLTSIPQLHLIKKKIINTGLRRVNFLFCFMWTASHGDTLAHVRLKCAPHKSYFDQSKTLMGTALFFWRVKWSCRESDCRPTFIHVLLWYTETQPKNSFVLRYKNKIRSRSTLL
jgi:hypothetical protein